MRGNGLSAIAAGGEIGFGPFPDPTPVIPIASFPVTVLEEAFEMGGFQNITGTPITLQPDNIPPVVSTHGNITRNLSAGGTVTIGLGDILAFANDNSNQDVQLVSISPSSFDCNDIGQHEVTLVMTDGRCNETTATSIVNIQDATPPTVIGQNHVVLSGSKRKRVYFHR